MLLQKIGIKQDEEEWLGTRINSADAIDSARQDLEQKEREIRRELEQEVKKAKATLESEVNNLVRRVGRNF